VSSGESSAAAQPALDGDALTSAGAHQADVTLAGTGSPHPPKPVSSPAAAKREASNDATIAEPHKPPGSSSGASSPIYAAIGATILEVGTMLGGRYEIQKLLGMGGMGAVYKANDLEVDRCPPLGWMRDLVPPP
jgi:hypothetical protein